MFMGEICDTCEGLWGGRVGDDGSVLGEGAHLRLWGAAGGGVSERGHHHPGLQLHTGTHTYTQIKDSAFISLHDSIQYWIPSSEIFLIQHCPLVANVAEANEDLVIRLRNIHRLVVFSSLHS